MKPTFPVRGRILIGQASLGRYRIRMQNLIETGVFLGTVQNLIETDVFLGRVQNLIETDVFCSELD